MSFLILFLLIFFGASSANATVHLQIEVDKVVLRNDRVELTLSNPDGHLTSLQYLNGSDNLLFFDRRSRNTGGYWDIVWTPPNERDDKFEVIRSTRFEVVVQTEQLVEVSFQRPWVPAQNWIAPINMDIRYILLGGSSGFYSYAVYERPDSPEWPAFTLSQTRMAFKLNIEKFRFMAAADNRRRHMPLPEDRLAPRGEELSPVEAVLLINPVEPDLKGEVDDKYQFSSESMDLRVHGWVSAEKPVVGFWQINPSTEFRIGGPFKQELSSHAGPTTLAMFGSTHYVGPEMLTKFEKGEKWKKVFGPVFLYMNTVADGKDIPLQLWEDAKRQMMVETESWPYNFPASEDFPKAHDRGKVVGRLIVRDRYIDKDLIIAGGAYVGLASPGDAGSWQLEAKAYQFWTRADEKGYFSINNIRMGEYNIYASVPGFIGDYRNDAVITITSGSEINVGNLLFKPPRAGPTLWEIGIPDRSGAEFYIPNPDPKYYNKFLDLPGSKFRQHGLWERYTELYPHGDLVFKIGESDYQKDWFFAQVTRKNIDNTYQGTSWQIQFQVDKIIHRAAYKLWVAVAAANNANLQVLVNNQSSRHPLFSSGRLGRDNVIARHGIHGLYQLFGLDIHASLLVEGINTFFFNQLKKDNMFVGIIYDYIRLEGPFLPK